MNTYSNTANRANRNNKPLPAGSPPLSQRESMDALRQAGFVLAGRVWSEREPYTVAVVFVRPTDVPGKPIEAVVEESGRVNTESVEDFLKLLDPKPIASPDPDPQETEPQETEPQDTDRVNEVRDPRFFFAGRALFTVSNPSGRHFTFKINQPKKREGDDREPPFFASIADNEGEKVYMGIVNPETLEIFPTRASRVSKDAESWKVLQWTLRMVGNGRDLPAGYHCQHNGICCACGKTLTDPESIDLGIGPVCREKAGW